LRALGARDAAVTQGGVTFHAGRRLLYAVNLWMRTASRVTMRLGEFRATEFHELERKARRLPWASVLTPGTPIQLRATCRKSRLYHSDAVSERVAGAIADAVGSEVQIVDESTPAAAQLIVIRVFHDRCTVSADTSGALLHQRGYRQAIAKAPMRETLAAAMLLASGSPIGAPLVDPFCGSGTIAIEAALRARRIAPGRLRRFAFMDWPDFDQPVWDALVAEADAGVLPRAASEIVASDRDLGAVAATTANAERAGVAADIEVRNLPVSALEVPRDVGWIVTNPPYGVRVGDADALRDLYARFGDVVRRHARGWTVAFLSADRRLERQMRLPLTVLFRTTNGGIPVRLVHSVIAGAPAAGASPEA
jgi:putative N6-adenine-specific DNA methylase